MNRTIKSSLVAVFIATVTVLAPSVPVLARQGSDDNQTTQTEKNETSDHNSSTQAKTTTTSHEATETEEQHEAAVEAAREKLRGKLDDAHEKACENREVGIENTIKNAGAAGQRQLNLFSDIATRVEQFYVNKKLSAAGYAAAVADVNSKISAAQTAVDAVKNSQPNIDCKGDDPIGQVNSYRTKVQAMHNALNSLKTSVKSLIVIVKQALEAQGQ